LDVLISIFIVIILVFIIYGLDIENQLDQVLMGHASY